MAEFLQFLFKGVQTKVSDLLMDNSELKEAVNVDLSKIGVIQKRPGYFASGDTLQADKDVLGLATYYKSDGTNQMLAATNNSDDTSLVIKMRTTQNYNVTVQTIAGKEDAKLEFVNFIDYLFGVGYDSTDKVFVDTFCWNGSAYSVATNLTDAPNGKYVIVINGYVCVINGEDHNSNRATSRVWWADPPTSLPVTLAWDNDNNWWDFLPHNGQEITGAISNFNRGLIFKNTSFHLFDPVGQTSNTISNSIGCDSHRSIQNVGNFTLFFNRNGVYATNGSEPTLISQPVRAFIDAINKDNLEKVVAGVRSDRYYHLFINDVTVNGTTYTNCELVYDILQNSWTTNELQNNIIVYASYVRPEETTTTSTSSSSSSSSSSSLSSSSSSISSTSISTSSISTSSISSSSSSNTTISTVSTSSSSSTTSSSSISTTVTGTTTQTILSYPDAHPESTSVDGVVSYEWGGVGITWITLRNGAGNNSIDTGSNDEYCMFISSTENEGNYKWKALFRGIFLFDTSTLGVGSTVITATLSLYASWKADGLNITPNIDIYTSAPASNTALVSGDYDSLGTISQTGFPITYANWTPSSYNNFTFNATGKGNISLTGISKFGTRNANYDVANNEPTWTSSLNSWMSCYQADNAGTTKDPKLTIIYS